MLSPADDVDMTREPTIGPKCKTCPGYLVGTEVCSSL